MPENDELVAAILTAGLLARDGGSERGAVDRYKAVLKELRNLEPHASVEPPSLLDPDPDPSPTLSTEDRRAAIYERVVKLDPGEPA